MSAASLMICRPVIMLVWVMHEQDQHQLSIKDGWCISSASTCRSACHTYRDQPYAAEMNTLNRQSRPKLFTNRQQRSVAECASIPAHAFALVKAGASEAKQGQGLQHRYATHVNAGPGQGPFAQ